MFPELETPKRAVILRFSGEIFTKSRSVRAWFIRRVKENAAAALERAGIDDYEMHHDRGRLDVICDDERAPDVLERIFGLTSVTPAELHPCATLDDVVEAGAAIFADRVPGRRFAVRTRRTGSAKTRIPFTSKDVEIALGSRLVDAGGSVDLDDPDVVCGVEVREGLAFFYHGERPGAGGLPTGVEGRALALISGGFDSAVAAWSILRRGVAVDFVFFNLAGPPQERATREVTQALCRGWAHGYEPKLHVVDFRPVVADLKAKTKGSFWQVVLKRLMKRAADAVARAEGHSALVTGESIGQVSSQTLPNLAAIAAPFATPVLRPLVAMDKEEIIARSRRIGTHDISSGVPEFCALAGGAPVTRATTYEIDAEEEKLDLALIDRLVDERAIHDALTMEYEAPVEVELDQVPDEAVVMDLRTRVGERDWRYPDSIHLPFETASEQWPRLPQGKTYLFYCDVGLKSAYLADRMQAAGFDAFSFKGGVPRLKRWQKRRASSES